MRPARGAQCSMVAPGRPERLAYGGAPGRGPAAANPFGGEGARRAPVETGRTHSGARLYEFLELHNVWPPASVSRLGRPTSTPPAEICHSKRAGARACVATNEPVAEALIILLLRASAARHQITSRRP